MRKFVILLALAGFMAFSQQPSQPVDTSNPKHAMMIIATFLQEALNQLPTTGIQRRLLDESWASLAAVEMVYSNIYSTK